MPFRIGALINYRDLDGNVQKCRYIVAVESANYQEPICIRDSDLELLWIEFSDVVI